MIIVSVDKPIDLSPQIVKVKVVGEQGKTLHVQIFGVLFYDYSSGNIGNIFVAYLRQLLGNKIFDRTYSITSDPYEVSIIWRNMSLPWFEVAVMSITVEDSNGNVVEGTTYVLAYDAYGSIVTVSDRTEVWYIFTLGGQVLHMVLYPGQQYILPNHESFVTIVWREGYIAVYRGKTKIFEASGGSAIFTLQFKIDPDTAKLFGNYIEAPDIASIVYKAPELAPWIGIVDYFRHVLHSTRLSVIGVDASYDGSYYYVNVSVQADLKSPIDIQNILRIIAGIAAIIVGGVIAVKSLGVALPVAVKLFTFGAGLVLSGIGLYVVMTTPSTENPSGTKQAADIVTDQAIRKLEAFKQTLIQVIDQLYNQGKITKDEHDRLVNYVTNEITDAEEYIKVLNKMVTSAYEQGKREMYPWIVVSFIGGVLVGSMLERAAMPRIAPR